MKNILKVFGFAVIIAAIGFSSLSLTGCGDGGNPPLIITQTPPEALPDSKRWSTWTARDSTATINISVNEDVNEDESYICTITVGGTAMPPETVDNVLSYWNSVWKANAFYKYTAVKGKTYTYTFEAWTDGADRAMVVQWYEDGANSQNTGYDWDDGEPPHPPSFKINSTRQSYSIKGKEPIPKGGIQNLEFQCANQTGTFYVKIISITPSNTGGATYTGSVADFAAWLANTTAPTYNVKLNINDEDDFYTIQTALLNNPNKYINLDLSGSTTTIIPNSAFVGCVSLIGITIPDSITSIEGYAFYGCDGLTGITIPNSVTSIGIGAFLNCGKLLAINVDTGNSAYTAENGVLYNKNKTTLHTYPEGKTGGFTIPNGVTSIEMHAFQNSWNLTNVTIPNSVTSIGWSAFGWCGSLTSITIPSSVNSIYEGAFRNCYQLTVINVAADNITYISQDGILYNKAKTTLHTYPGGKTNTSFTIPNTITSIEAEAFSGNSKLTSVTIPDSVTSIGMGAFYGCTGLTSIIIPDSVTSIGDWAFQDCTKLASVTIPDSVTSIGDGAFYGCSSLTSVTFQGTIFSSGFSLVFPFPGDLRDKFYEDDADNGTPGTYITTVPVSENSTWTKLP